MQQRFKQAQGIEGTLTEHIKIIDAMQGSVARDTC